MTPDGVTPDGVTKDGEQQGSRASHAVVLGCGRSGTSILGELFAGLPGYTYYTEPPFEELAGYDYGAPVAIKVPKPAAALRMRLARR